MGFTLSLVLQLATGHGCFALVRVEGRLLLLLLLLHLGLQSFQAELQLAGVLLVLDKQEVRGLMSPLESQTVQGGPKCQKFVHYNNSCDFCQPECVDQAFSSSSW